MRNVMKRVRADTVNDGQIFLSESGEYWRRVRRMDNGLIKAKAHNRKETQDEYLELAPFEKVRVAR